MQVLLGVKYYHDQGIFHEEMILRKIMVVEEDEAYSPIHVKLSDLMSFVYLFDSKTIITVSKFLNT